MPAENTKISIYLRGTDEFFNIFFYNKSILHYRIRNTLRTTDCDEIIDIYPSSCSRQTAV